MAESWLVCWTASSCAPSAHTPRSAWQSSCTSGRMDKEVWEEVRPLHPHQNKDLLSHQHILHTAEGLVTSAGLQMLLPRPK